MSILAFSIDVVGIVTEVDVGVVIVVGIVAKVDVGVIIVVAVGGGEVLVGVNIVIATGVVFNVLVCSLSLEAQTDRQTDGETDRQAL